ncbi:hypothetical protein [Phaeovulum sp. W22_SRMD_FR3]|uniref:hypothetical protein n=1 Tax=Phaeovulum sp. W22_SRMD_FR3 TaxID=3240274 RepID=UPI003F977F63
MNRRAFLSAAPALSLATLPAAAAADPILPLYERWWFLFNEWNRLCTLLEDRVEDTPEMDAIFMERWRLYGQIADTAPRSAAGVAAMAHVMWIEEGPSSIPDTPAYHTEITLERHRLLQSLRRGALEMA